MIGSIFSTTFAGAGLVARRSRTLVLDFATDGERSRACAARDPGHSRGKSRRLLGPSGSPPRRTEGVIGMFST